MLLAAFGAVKDQPQHTLRLQQRTEDLHVAEVGQRLIPLGDAERLRVVGLAQLGSGVVRVIRERVAGDVFQHASHLMTRTHHGE
jgi:hypothetical protein